MSQQPPPPMQMQPGQYNTAYQPDPNQQPPPQYAQPGVQPGMQPYTQQPQAYGQPAAPGMYAQPQMQQPVSQQGVQVQWMARPAGLPNCPPGLEYLASIDQLLVKQQIELLELFTGWETNNKYRVLNSMNQQVFFAAEESDLCMRQCCGPNRGFVLHITDNAGVEVMRVRRDFKCCAGCCWCAASEGCAFEVVVEAASGEILGYVRQEYSCCAPKLSVRDSNHEVGGIIEGPFCQCACCADINFPVFSPSGPEIGKITKQWTGCFKEYVTDADNFAITFPMDMDVRMKATMMGALFLVDFMFFEQKQNNNN